MENINAKAVKKTAAKRAATTKLEPFLEEIKQRAYEIYVSKGSEPGNDQNNWLQAEKEIKRKHNIQ